MAKRRENISSATAQKRFDKGHGRGELEEYKPWILVQNISSKGRSHRIKGNKINRVHHFLSDGELKLFHYLEWSPSVSDIREQYPLLPVEETVEIAQELSHQSFVGGHAVACPYKDLCVGMPNGASALSSVFRSMA